MESIKKKLPIIEGKTIEFSFIGDTVRMLPFIKTYNDGYNEVINNPEHSGIFKNNIFLNKYEDREPEDIVAHAHRILALEGKKITSKVKWNDTDECRSLKSNWKLIHIVAKSKSLQPIVSFHNKESFKTCYYAINKQYVAKDEYISMDILVDTTDMKNFIINLADDEAGYTYTFDKDITTARIYKNIQGHRAKLTFNGKELTSEDVKVYHKDQYKYHAIDINGARLIIDDYNPDLRMDAFSFIEKGMIFKVRQIRSSKERYNIETLNIDYDEKATLPSIKRMVVKGLLKE